MVQEKRRWREAEDEYLMANLHLDTPELSRALKRSKKAVLTRIERLRSRESRAIEHPRREPYRPLFMEKTGSVAVTSDWHVPYQDRSQVDRLLDVCDKRNIGTLVIAGGFLNLGALSGFLSPPCPPQPLLIMSPSR